MTYQDCLPYMCSSTGSAGFDMATVLACSEAGFVGVKSCADPDCQGYCPNSQIAPYVPIAPTADTIDSNMPDIAAALLATGPAANLTPNNIQPSFPDITSALAPAVVVVSPCDWWQKLNGAIAEHPLIAIGVLAAAFAAAHPKTRQYVRRKRRA